MANLLNETFPKRLPESQQALLRKIAAGDADFTAGRVVSMDEVEKRTQAVIDRALAKKLK